MDFVRIQYILMIPDAIKHARLGKRDRSKKLDPWTSMVESPVEKIHNIVVELMEDDLMVTRCIEHRPQAADL